MDRALGKFLLARDREYASPPDCFYFFYLGDFICLRGASSINNLANLCLRLRLYKPGILYASDCTLSTFYWPNI